MKKVRLNENDIERLVKKILKEDEGFKDSNEEDFEWTNLGGEIKWDEELLNMVLEKQDIKYYKKAQYRVEEEPSKEKTISLIKGQHLKDYKGHVYVGGQFVTYPSITKTIPKQKGGDKKSIIIKWSDDEVNGWQFYPIESTLLWLNSNEWVVTNVG